MANKKVKFELTAVDKTKAAFDKVTKGLKGVGSAAASASKGVAGVGLAAVASAAALGVLVNKSFQFIDAIGKTSTMTGIATDTIQAFHLAARESGTNIEGANNALVKFARSVGDAQRGLKTQQDIFKAINVELVDASGNYRTTDAILADTAKGISELGSQTEKATALANLFGRQGILLTGAIEDLSKRGLDGFIQRAEDLGLILSTKVIRRTEAFNDSLGVLGMQVKAVRDNITTAFLPVFEKMQEKIAKVFKTIKEDSQGFDKLGMNIANAVIDGIAASIMALGEFQLTLANLSANLDTLLPSMTLKFAGFANSIIGMIPGMKGFGTAIELFAIQKQAELAIALAETVEGNDAFRNSAVALANELLGLKITVDDIEDSFANVDGSIKNSADAMFNAMNPLTAYKNSLEETGKALDNIAVNSMKKFEDSLVEGLKSGKLAFKDFATFVVEQLIRVAIQQLIIARLVDPFRAAITPGNFGQSLLGDTDSIAQGFAGGGYTGNGARAGGVDGKGGFPAILHPQETVIDHAQGQGMGATVNFNISTVDATGFDELLASRKGLITSIINNAMNNRGRMGVT
jgi:hypothetical protein